MIGLAPAVAVAVPQEISAKSMVLSNDETFQMAWNSKVAVAEYWGMPVPDIASVDRDEFVREYFASLVPITPLDML